MNDQDFAREELSSEQLKDAAVAGVRWTTAARVGIEVITLASAVVLARLIGPSGFGQAVVPLIFVPLAVILTFEGFGSALVQRKEIGRAHVEAAMLASLLTGVVLTLLTLALAEPVGKPLFGSDTAALLMMISPVFLLAGLCAVSRSLLWPSGSPSPASTPRRSCSQRSSAPPSPPCSCLPPRRRQCPAGTTAHWEKSWASECQPRPPA